MRFGSALVLALSVVTTGTAAFVAGPALAAKKEEAPKLKPSPEFVKAYLPVEKQLAAKDFNGAKAQIAAVEALAKTPDDQYLVGSLYLNTGLGLNDQSLQRAGLERMLASGMTPAADVGKFQFYVGRFALVGKEYDKAIVALTAATQAGYGESMPYIFLAESYFGKANSGIVNNQFSPAGKQVVYQGLDVLNKAIGIETAAGRKAEGAWYSRGFRMAILSGSPDLAKWTDMALKNDPKPDNWRLALRGYQDANKAMTREENLDVLRLLSSTGALKEAYDYQEYVEAAIKAGLFGEAKAVIDAGRAAGHLQPTMFKEQYQIVVAGIPKDKASLPAAAVDSARAANGRTAMFTANAYLGYGDYAKAAELYRLALQKGGVDGDEINTHLGMALAKAGDVAGAKAALAAVTKPGTRKTIAELWALWLNSKAG